MPQNKNTEPASSQEGAELKSATSQSGSTVELPSPTEDEQQYLSEITKAEREYDRNAIIGGQRPDSAG